MFWKTMMTMRSGFFMSHNASLSSTTGKQVLFLQLWTHFCWICSVTTAVSYEGIFIISNAVLTSRCVFRFCSWNPIYYQLGYLLLLPPCLLCPHMQFPICGFTSDFQTHFKMFKISVGVAHITSKMRSYKLIHIVLTEIKGDSH